MISLMSDYIEQISHSICTLEFVMHRELYNWFWTKSTMKLSKTTNMNLRV
jgi:glutamyl/glutaminyl-tRNA synthetase